MENLIAVYLPEGFADWECAFLLPELRASQRAIMVVTENGKPVKSIGGLMVTPDGALSELDSSMISALILIGSDDWANRHHNRSALETAKEVFAAGKVLGAICAGANAVAREGLLNERDHTGNDLDYLKKYVPEYQGEKHYKNQRAVRDGNLVTASGINPIDFTFEVMNALNLYSEKYRQQWLTMLKSGTQPPMEFWEEQMRPG